MMCPPFINPGFQYYPPFTPMPQQQPAYYPSPFPIFSAYAPPCPFTQYAQQIINDHQRAVSSELKKRVIVPYTSISTILMLNDGSQIPVALSILFPNASRSSNSAYGRYYSCYERTKQLRSQEEIAHLLRYATNISTQISVRENRDPQQSPPTTPRENTKVIYEDDELRIEEEPEASPFPVLESNPPPNPVQQPPQQQAKPRLPIVTDVDTSQIPDDQDRSSQARYVRAVAKAKEMLLKNKSYAQRLDPTSQRYVHTPGLHCFATVRVGLEKDIDPKNTTPKDIGPIIYAAELTDGENFVCRHNNNGFITNSLKPQDIQKIWATCEELTPTELQTELDPQNIQQCILNARLTRTPLEV